MALKRYRFGVTVGVPDPARDEPEVRDPVTGQLVTPFRKGLRHVPPGEEVEVEEQDAERIIARFGTYENFQRTQAENVAALAQAKAGRKILR